MQDALRHGDKKTTGVAAETKLKEIYGSKYRISLNHQILSDHGVFYPQALYNDLVFQLTLAPTLQVVRGSDPTKLKYKLSEYQLEYQMIRSKTLADKVHSVYSSDKEFAYDHVFHPKMVPFKKDTDTLLNITVNPQRRSMKGILLLFVEPYAVCKGFRKMQVQLRCAHLLNIHL